MPENWWNPMAWDAPFPVVVAALFVVVLARASATYAIGRLAARGSGGTRLGRVMERPGFVRAVDRIERMGAPVVSLSFLTVGVQTVVNFTAGFLRMPLWRYLPALLLGCLMWALIYASAGFVGVTALVQAWRRHPLLAIGLVTALVASSVVLRSPRGPRSTSRRDG